MADLVEEYAKARSDYEKMDRAVRSLASRIKRIGEEIERSPETFFFEGTASMLPNATAISGNGHPISDEVSADEIMILLARFHEARKRYADTYLAIPKETRKVLTAPPSSLLPPNVRRR